ncbi:hypothetical protein COCSADRAFT_36682 [Bipolaris sorokiniana ND90Pr]|uniref:Uncharacterized protein n=1 Tax=Cochliobolus sativus (strain ND90Pr / ATCC 201652) TaxID=665912 RepID=M2RBA3_COCSN|nr:uncharacterized protein COCSADRAFT_36682 [Bipolaris sorokiniana ND90Pr]EMD64104.1 hypothetical protein COCSADRAFT_36682 [Bipolaris sorokiniana ND90Pr]
MYMIATKLCDKFLKKIGQKSKISHPLTPLFSLYMVILAPSNVTRQLSLARLPGMRHVVA